MYFRYFHASILCVALGLLNCAGPRAISTIYADSYDASADKTTVTLTPFGVVEIPGKWRKTRESDVSGQHFFVGTDSVTLAIALNLWDRYEFSYNNPQITRENFVRAFYDWDATYVSSRSNSRARVVKEDKEQNYLVWSLRDDQRRNDYFLFGLKGQVAYSFYISSDSWNDQRQVMFLEEMFLK